MSTFEEELDRTGTLCWTNVGVSMMPLLRQHKDVMILKKRTDARLKRLDAVLFKRRNGQYILHRIIKVREKDYLIAGDNCFYYENVTDDMILAVLTGVVRNGKQFSVDNFKYKLYVHLWCDLWRVRFFILRSKAKIKILPSRCKHLIKKIFKIK